MTEEQLTKIYEAVSFDVALQEYAFAKWGKEAAVLLEESETLPEETIGTAYPYVVLNYVGFATGQDGEREYQFSVGCAVSDASFVEQAKTVRLDGRTLARTMKVPAGRLREGDFRALAVDAIRRASVGDVRVDGEGVFVNSPVFSGVSIVIVKPIATTRRAGA